MSRWNTTHAFMWRRDTVGAPHSIIEVFLDMLGALCGAPDDAPVSSSSAGACTMQQFMWQVDITGVAHIGMDCPPEDLMEPLGRMIFHLISPWRLEQM